MSEPDDKHRDAVAILEQIGYRWNDGAWELPHVEELAPERRLSIIDIGDLLYEGLEAASELWEQETSYGSRHIPRDRPRPRPRFTVVGRDDK